MPTRLRKLKITHVAACPQGANYDLATGEGAHILLFKSQDLAKQEGPTVSDVYVPTTGTCHDDACTSLTCPVHGARNRRRMKKPVEKDGLMAHAEPDGDETPPLSYAARQQQQDLWAALWDKWSCFTSTVYDCIGDADRENVGYLPILAQSISEFGADVEQLLVGCGVSQQAAPLLKALQACGTDAEVEKAGAAMAGHRRQRLQDAITALQQLLEECTPEDLPHGIQPSPDRAGVSAAEVRGFAGYMVKGRASEGPLPTPSQKGEAPMAGDKTLVVEGQSAQTQIEALTARAETAEARVAELEPLVAKVASLETTVAKMRQTPEEQEAEYWASVPEPVRKKHEADEAEKVELRKQLDDARAEREQTTYIAKTADFRGFGMVQKHWRLLKRIDEWPEEDREELLRLMKASQEQARTAGLFSATGTEGRVNGTSEASGSAADQLYALTEAYAVEKDVPFIKASEVIAKQHPELFRRASEERRQASRVSTT